MDYVQDSDDQIDNISEYSSSLKGLGYTEHEISTAYNWILDHLGSPAESLFSAFPDHAGSSRILTELERARLTPEAHGFLLKLHNLGVVDNEQFEAVLDRLTLAGQRLVTPEQVKLIVSAVMFSEFGDSDRNLMSNISADRSSCVN
jgi:Smg protein